MTVPLYVLRNSAQWFPFLHMLAAFFICVLSDDSHSDTCEVTSHCGFDLHFPYG